MADDSDPEPTHALSVLLNLARFTSIREFPDLAWFRTSEPMCSPSLSQSVQINSALLYLAWLRMFSAIGSLSYGGISEAVRGVSGARHEPCQQTPVLAPQIETREDKTSSLCTGVRNRDR